MVAAKTSATETPIRAEQTVVDGEITCQLQFSCPRGNDLPAALFSCDSRQILAPRRRDCSRPALGSCMYFTPEEDKLLVELKEGMEKLT